MDILLPVIYQHVREAAELQISVLEREHSKIITPFPPEGNDFLDISDEDLQFADAQNDGDAARIDTLKALEFFQRNDNLILDFSYGVKSEDYLLSTVFSKFYGQAITDDTPDAAWFSQQFRDKKEIFRKSWRKTVGDLGGIDFPYVYYSPIQWSKVELDEAEINRLQQKSLDVYGSLDIQSPLLNAIVEGIKSVSLCYYKIYYEIGYFDVVRDWASPELLESSYWNLPGEGAALFGEGNAAIDEQKIEFLYATRCYIIRKYRGLPKLHTFGEGIRNFPALAKPLILDHRATVVDMPIPAVNPERAAIRNVFLQRKLNALTTSQPVVKSDTAPTAPAGGGSYLWVLEKGGVAAHWERPRADPEADPNRGTISDSGSTYKIAAVKCRTLPRKSRPRPVQ